MPPAFLTLRFSTLLALGLLAGCAANPPAPVPPSGAAAAAAKAEVPAAPPVDPLLRARAAISSRDLLTGIEKLASDEFEGRAPGTHGETMTVEWLKARFKAVGLQPAGESGAGDQATKSRKWVSTCGLPRMLMVSCGCDA